MTNFTLRFPFQLDPARRISNLDLPVDLTERNLTFSLEQSGDYYILKVKGFDKESQAKDHVRKLWIALAWLSINRFLGFSASIDLDNVVYASDPFVAAENLRKSLGVNVEGPVDGLANGNMPTVYPTDKSVRFITSGIAELFVSMPADQVLKILIEGINLPNIDNIISDAKLCTALELYSSYFYESSPNTRFLTLIMALETLAINRTKHPLALEYLREWSEQIKKRKEIEDQGSDAYLALESLERELLFRKDMSIRSQIRLLVSETLSSVGNPAANTIALNALDVYDARSRLVHEGFLPITELRNSETTARTIVEQIIKAKLGLV